MDRFQKAVYIVSGLCFLLLVGISPDFFYYVNGIYRFMPVYCFLEQEAAPEYIQGDLEISEYIIKAEGEYLGSQMESLQKIAEVVTPTGFQETEPIKNTVTTRVMNPKIDLSAAKLADESYVLNQFFIVDSSTGIKKGLINANKFLKENLKIKKDPLVPQILIYHSHSQEAFIDSRPGNEEDTIVGVGRYLKEILQEKYGYNVVHITKRFDVMENGQVDRNAAYDYAREYILDYLNQNPTIQVLIDLHRDGVPENKKLVTTINGKKTAQIMFFNGLSYNQNGKVEYLPNPYIAENLAFSFQMEYQAALYYPDFYRGIYLAALRYNLHLRPRSILLEAGAQTNTVQEVKNAMEPFADILNRVLKVGDK